MTILATNCSKNPYSGIIKLIISKEGFIHICCHFQFSIRRGKEKKLNILHVYINSTLPFLSRPT